MEEVWLVKRIDKSNIHNYRTMVACVAKTEKLAERTIKVLQAAEEDAWKDAEYFVQRYRVIDNKVDVDDLIAYYL